MWFGVITLFPEMFTAISQYGITGQAVKKGLIHLECWNPRDFTYDKHRTVDDRPYGGGPGMLMKVQPLRDAIKAAKQKATLQSANAVRKTIYLSPQGKKLDQQGVETLADCSQLILVAGRYEGIDERLIETEIDEEWSVGDYVLSGGELPAMLLIDAIARTVPGIVGHEDSVKEDSFATGMLKYPHYTRPETYKTKRVPEVLLSGHHRHIDRWRLKQALGRTWLRRPELLAKRRCSQEEELLLTEFIEEYRAEKRNNKT